MDPNEFWLKSCYADPVANTQKGTLPVPAGVDPMVAEQRLQNALRDPVAIETWRVELSKIEKESK